jgi:hypothetical protein
MAKPFPFWYIGRPILYQKGDLMWYTLFQNSTLI